MMTDGKNEGTPHEDGGDGLWLLLERAPRPGPVSPYFARRVLREVALLDGARPAAGTGSGWLTRIRLAWPLQSRRTLAGALAAVALVAVGGAGFSVKRWHSPVVQVAVAHAEPTPADDGDEAAGAEDEADAGPGWQGTVAFSSDPVVTAQDVEVIADLDNLVSREESRLWTEDDTARF